MEEIKALIKRSPQSNALALEYQREYGSASGDSNVLNLVNNPNISGVCSVFGPGFFEQITDLPIIKVSVFSNDRTHALLIAHKAP